MTKSPLPDSAKPPSRPRSSSSSAPASAARSLLQGCASFRSRPAPRRRRPRLPQRRTHAMTRTPCVPALVVDPGDSVLQVVNANLDQTPYGKQVIAVKRTGRGRLPDPDHRGRRRPCARHILLPELGVADQRDRRPRLLSLGEGSRRRSCHGDRGQRHEQRGQAHARRFPPRRPGAGQGAHLQAHLPACCG